MEVSLDEDEIKLQLIGTPAECQRALNILYRVYRRKIVGLIAKNFPGLALDRVEAALVDTFAALHSSICDSRFDLDQPIGKFLFTVAKRKAVDQLRQQRSAKNTSTVSIEVFGHHLEDTDIGSRWKEILGEHKAETIRLLFLDFLSTLPPAQRQVAQIMADNFPEKISYEEYIDTIRERTGEIVTAVKVKSALANIREKFETLLKAKGIYDGRK